MVGSSREIWCSNRETGRFHEKLGDSRENRESWQVCYLATQVAFRIWQYNDILSCAEVVRRYWRCLVHCKFHEFLLYANREITTASYYVLCNIMLLLFLC